MNSHTIRISVIFTTGFSLFACAPLFGDDSIWDQSPRPRAVEASLKSSIGYYESAVAAINGRHYALALEYLQAARAQRPDDVRVLTAFGVVYDKLGRFDLSARYYTQASTLDPKSRVIAADLDYSRRLQGLSTGGPSPQVADAGPSSIGPSQPQTALASVEAPPPSLSVATANTGQVFTPRAADSATSNVSAVPKVAAAPASAAKGIAMANTGQAFMPKTEGPATGYASVTPKVAAAPHPAAKVVAAANIGQGSAPRTVAPAVSNDSVKPKVAAAPAPAARVVVTANIGQGSTPRAMDPATNNASIKAIVPAVPAPAAKPVAVANIGQGSMPRTVAPVANNVSAKAKAPAALASTPAAKVVAAANIRQGSTPRTVNPATNNASAKAIVPAAPAPAAKVVAVTNSGQGVTRRTVAPAMSNAPAIAKMPAAPAPATKTLVLTGHPLAIVDASGRGDTDKSVRGYLSGRGWSVAKNASAKMPAQAQTVILYKETMITAAKALARTLSLPMRLTVSNDILGLQLVLGGDISGTNIAKKNLAPQHHQIALAAANTGKRE